MFTPVSLPVPAGGSRHPASVLVYARSRSALDPVAASIALEFSDAPLWIEVRETLATAEAENPPEELFASMFTHRFELEPGELLPRNALAHLGIGASAWPRSDPGRTPDPQDLTWLPSPIHSFLTGRRRQGLPVSVVIARAERLVLELPVGLEEAGRLLDIFGRHGVTLVAGLLARPLPEFANLFDYVVRVRPETDDSWGKSHLVVERRPALNAV